MPNLEELMDQSEIDRSPATTDPRLKNARRLATAGASLGWILVFVAIYGVGDYEWLMLVMLSIPWVAVGLTWYYKGTFRFYYSRKSLYPTLSATVMLVETAALIVVFRRYGIYEWDKTVWLSLAVLSVLVFLVWRVACGAAIAQEKDTFGTLGALIVAVVLYSFSALIFTNCNYDRSAPRIWRVAVKKKYVSTARKTTYSLKLSPWGRFTEEEWVDVPSNFYHGVALGDTINVDLKTGKWGISWYQVTKD